MATPRYYMPYESGSDNGAGSDTDTGDDSEDYDSDNLPNSEDPRIRREEDPRYAILRAAGPNFNTSAQQIKYMEGMHGLGGAAYDTSTNITTLQNAVYLNPPKTTLTSLFSVKADNRDRRVFPSPFNFEIKLPRVFKNVTKFQLVQLSFPNNTVDAVITTNKFLSTLVEVLENRGVDPSCITTCLNLTECTAPCDSFAILEEGRYNSVGEPIMTTIRVPDGIYDNNVLTENITIESNNTPPFNIISYDEFKAIYQTTGDISVLFNEPGDYFKSRLTGGTVHRRFNKDTIMSTYYSRQYIDSLVDITDEIAFNAYYYPILKELIATGRAKPFLILGDYSYDQIVDIVNHFEGLNSGHYYNICMANIDTLTAYRRFHTFELRNINNYIWSWNTLTGQMIIQHDKLHTSIRKDIDGQYNKIFQNNLAVAGLNSRSFQTLKDERAQKNTILKHLESHLSTVIGQYHFATKYKYLGGDQHSTNEGVWAAEELASDADFTSMFNFTSRFGNQFLNNPGIPMTFTNFLDFHSTMSSYYNLVASATSTISSIQGLTYQTHTDYVSKKYGSVMPQSFISNGSFNNTGVGVSLVGGQTLYAPGFSLGEGCSSDYCANQCCTAIKQLILSWYGCLPTQGIVTNLSYRLGINVFTNFASIPTILSTILETSTGQLNYFLQINNDQSFNNMDVAMTEDYNVTNETTGQVKLMYAKILTAGIGAGEISQTVIQNPVIFENPLGKLDKLQFKFYFDNEDLTPAWQVLPFEVGFNNWDATFQIDEEIGFANRDAGFSGNIPTVAIPNDPSAIQYMALTGVNNPDNK
jgi:hypothetical protein